LIYGVISSYYVPYDEVFALYARLDHSLGGLGWKSEQIGMAFSFGGIAMLLFQGFCYHHIERRYFLFTFLNSRIGAIKCFRLGVCLAIPCFIVLPRASMLIDSLPDGHARQFTSETAMIWILVFGCAALRSVSSLLTFTSCFILIANASDPSCRGRVLLKLF
jgi:hypothetical protein